MDTIGSYRLGKTIGQGNYAKVRIAEHVETGLQVAVKIGHNQKTRYEDILKEARIQRRLDHQNVVRILDVIEADKDISIAMEFVGGGTLLEYIHKKGKLCEDEARWLFQQVIYGVEHCHHCKVAHLDIKAENILLSADLNVKIADFGFAAEIREGELLTQRSGTPQYVAPELVYNNCKYEGPEVDVWSCGVLLYVLLCHAYPFTSEQLPELFRRIKEGKYNVPEFVSSEAQDLIRRMLTIDPSKRISVREIRKHSWFGESIAKVVPENIHEVAPESIPRVPESIREDMLKSITEVVPGSTLLVPESIPEHMPANMTEVLPESIHDVVPEMPSVEKTIDGRVMARYAGRRVGHRRRQRC